DKVGTTSIIETTREERLQYCLGEADVLTLARWAVAIEKHYQRPMDIEWAKDGETGELFVVQARPETVQSQKALESIKTFKLNDQGEALVQGLAIGDAIATGKVCLIRSVE